MVSNKKIERALHGPGPFEIILGVVFSITLGIALAWLHLMFKPVPVVTKPPEGAAPGEVYFLEGSANSGKARQWVRKRQMLAEGNGADVTLTEDELNAWMASATPKAQAAAGATPGLFTPDRINVRIQAGVLQVGVTGKVSALGLTRDLVVQTRGKFVPGPAGFEFTADEFYIGALPVHLIPGLTHEIIHRVVAAQDLSEDLKTAWKQMKLVAVEENVLRLTLP
jgi:hypothetical protein